MPQDNDKLADVLQLVQDAAALDRQIELLCDIRHRLRGLSVTQLEEVQRVVEFISRRDQTSDDVVLRILKKTDDS